MTTKKTQENKKMYKVFYCDNCKIITINVVKYEERKSYTSLRYNNNSLEEVNKIEIDNRTKIICGVCKNISQYRDISREIFIGEKLYNKVLKSDVKIEIEDNIRSISDNDFLKLNLIDVDNED